MAKSPERQLEQIVRAIARHRGNTGASIVRRRRVRGGHHLVVASVTKVFVAKPA